MKKNFTIFKSAMMLICALLLMQVGTAQRTTIAGWSFPAGPGSVNTYPADCGSGTIYLNGTHGSSNWRVTGSSGSTNNSANFYQNGYILSETILACPDLDNVRGKKISLIGQANNDSCVSFAFSTTDLQNITMSFDCRVTSTAYKTLAWSYSVDDGLTFIDYTTLNYTNTSTDTLHHVFDFSEIEAMNNAETVILRLTVSGATADNGNCGFDNILITGESNVERADQPIFSINGGNFCAPVDVTMTSETPNASIYYTTDGSDPDESSTLYSGPVHIDATTELRAIAYADGLAGSFLTTATYTFPTSVSTIAEFKALGGNGDYYKLSCPVTAVFQNNKYLFVEDEAHTGLCLYKQQGSYAMTYVNGDVITDGICGINYKYSNAVIELQNPEFVNETPTAGTAIEPVPVTMAQLRINWNTYDSRLVTISGVTFEEGTFGNTSSFQKIYQNGDSLGCANVFGNLTGVTAPISTANVTGFTFNNTSLKRILPRNANDIVDLLPSITINTPTEGQVIEQGNPVHVDLDIENFDFENGSMIEGKLFVNGQAVTTQYLHNATELAVFENTDLSTLMTEFGEYTIIVSLVDANNQPFTIPATDTVNFTYSALYVAIEASENSLSFTETGESHTFDVTAFHLTEAITMAVDNSNFTVSPATLPATAENETVTVTFTGDASATGTLTLTSGATTTTVALSAVIPIDELIYSVGFETDEGFTASSTYNNTNIRYMGPEGHQWGAIHGTVMNGSTNNPAIVGNQSLQMRYYGNPSSGTYGVMGYSFTNFDIHNVTKVEFNATSTEGNVETNLKLRVSFSHDGGETFEGDSVFVPSTSSQRFTYFISDSGQYYSVRVKFAVELPEQVPSNTVRLTIDAVDFYGVTGMEANVVETPVISVPSGTYTTPQTVSITCATENARIYYTLDGTTPDESSSLYENPITIESSCTLKAKAFKGGMDPSNTAIAEYNFPIEVATIADFKAAGALDNSVTYKITGDITFVYRNANNIFIEDATGGLLVYDNNTPVVTGSYNEGDIISGGILGTYTLYHGMVEMIPTADWAAASGSTTVTPTVATADDIVSEFATYETRLVRINAGVFAEEASFSAGNATNATLTDATGDIVVRSQFKTLDTTVNAGDTVDIIGFAAIYANNGTNTYQIFPRTNADIIPVTSDTTDTPEDTVGIRTFVPVILSVWPNPATDVITVSSEENGGSLELLNAFGQVVYRCNTPSYPMTIDLNDKAAGLYFVRVITTDKRIAIVKVSKE